MQQSSVLTESNPSSIAIGSRSDGLSHKVLLDLPSCTAFAVYDQHQSVLRLYDHGDFSCRCERVVVQRRIVALNHYDGSNGASIMGSCPGGLYIWQDLLSHDQGVLPYWRHVHTQSLQTCLRSHLGAVYGGSCHGPISIYNPARTQALVQTLYGHSGQVNDLLVIPNQIVTGSDDRSIRLWDIASSKQVDQSTGQSPVQSLAYSGSGAQVVSAERNGVVSMWSIGHGFHRPIHTIANAHHYNITTCEIVPHSSYLITADVKGLVNVWDMRTYRQLQSFPSSTLNPSVVVARRRLIIAGNTSTASLYDLLGQESLPPARDHCSTVPTSGPQPKPIRRTSGTILYCREASRFLSTAGRALLVWDATDGRLVLKNSNLCRTNITSSCLKSIHFMFVGDDSGYVHLVDYRSCRAVHRFADQHEHGPISWLSYRALCDTITSIAMGDDQCLSTVEVNVDGSRRRPHRLRFSTSFPLLSVITDQRDDILIAFGAASDRVAIATTTSSVRQEMALSGGMTIVKIMLIANGTLLASAADDGLICLWRTDSVGDQPPVIRFDCVRDGVSPSAIPGTDIVMTYEDGSACFFTGVGDRGMIAQRRIRTRSGSELGLDYIRRFRVRSFPVRELTVVNLAARRYALASVSAWGIELYSASAELIGLLPNTGRSCLSWRIAITDGKIAINLPTVKPISNEFAADGKPKQRKKLEGAKSLPNMNSVQEPIDCAENVDDGVFPDIAVVVTGLRPIERPHHRGTSLESAAASKIKMRLSDRVSRVKHRPGDGLSGISGQSCVVGDDEREPEPVQRQRKQQQRAKARRSKSLHCLTLLHVLAQKKQRELARLPDVQGIPSSYTVPGKTIAPGIYSTAVKPEGRPVKVRTPRITNGNEKRCEFQPTPVAEVARKLLNVQVSIPLGFDATRTSHLTFATSPFNYVLR